MRLYALRGANHVNANESAAILSATDELMREHTAQAREIAAQFPHLRARIATASTEYAAAPEQSFEFGLQAILDGLAARVASRERESGRTY